MPAHQRSLLLFSIQFYYAKKWLKALWTDPFQTSTVTLLRALHNLNTTISADSILISYSVIMSGYAKKVRLWVYSFNLYKVVCYNQRLDPASSATETRCIHSNVIDYYSVSRERIANVHLWSKWSDQLY